MLAAERQREILSLLASNGGVRVTRLAQRFNVTEETIRRDLEKLDGAGKLHRIHGGAVSVEELPHELFFEYRRSVHLGEKRVIARAALEHIHPGDVIALDASTTAAELAALIPDIPITLVTNSLPVVNALLGRDRVRVIFLGGNLDPPSLSTSGALAERALERFNIEKLFLSSKGVDPERGLSLPEEEQARLKGRMVALAERTFVLADSSKIGARSTFFFAALAEIHHLITDAKAPPDVLADLRRGGLSIETANGSAGADPHRRTS